MPISQLEQKGDPALGTRTTQPAPASTSGASSRLLGLITATLTGLGPTAPSVTARQPGGQQDKAEVGETLLAERAEAEHAS